MEKLARTAKFPLSVEEMRECEELDQLRIMVRKRGERGCRKLYISRVESHLEVKKARSRLRLVDALIRRKEDTSKAKWRTISKLEKIVDGQHLLKLSLQALWSIRP
eukprot:10724261-Ditylum_brightwellii.AAC.1